VASRRTCSPRLVALVASDVTREGSLSYLVSPTKAVLPHRRGRHPSDRQRRRVAQRRSNSLLRSTGLGGAGRRMLPPSTSTEPGRVRPGLVDLGQLEAIVGTRSGVMSLVIPGRISRSGAEPRRVRHQAGDGVRSLLQSDDGTHRRIVVLLPPARLTSFPGKSINSLPSRVNFWN